MSNLSTPLLPFLDEFEPIPDDVELEPTLLLEKDYYNHLYLPPASLMIRIPRKGARRLLDIMHALRLENRQVPAFTVKEMRFPPQFFGIVLQQEHSGEVGLRSNGLCYIKICNDGSKWCKTGWFNLRKITEIAGDEKSSLKHDPESLGNLRISIFMFQESARDGRKSTYCNEDMTTIPILSQNNLIQLASRVIPWHGVDPVQDGHMGVAGYLIKESDHQGQYSALDIFVRDSDRFMAKKHEDGIVIATSIVEERPDGEFNDVFVDAIKRAPEDIREYILRALGDLTITYQTEELQGRLFHNNSIFSFEEGARLLSRYGLSLVPKDAGHDILDKDGKSLLEPDLSLEALDAHGRDLVFAARFVDNMLKRLRDRPFLYRRNVIMNTPFDLLI